MAQIQNEVAYDAAIKRNIIGNALKTWRANTDRADEVESAVAAGRRFNDYGDLTGYSDDFIGSIACALDTYGKLTPNQTAAVLKGIDARAARKAEWAEKQVALNASRKHIGEVGQKIKLDLIVKKVVTLEGLQFNGRHGFNFIFIMEDADQNVFIYKGTSGALTDCYENDAVSLMATVKEHSEREGVKQTIIQRPKRI
jgi:hypothetical protein